MLAGLKGTENLRLQPQRLVGREQPGCQVLTRAAQGQDLGPNLALLARD